LVCADVFFLAAVTARIAFRDLREVHLDRPAGDFLTAADFELDLIASLVG
jgi:hypothetical protein